jgi:hypothetical protein
MPLTNFALAASQRNVYGVRGGNAEIPLIVAIIFGGTVWLVFFIWGVLVSAQGQILKASLDGAVNGSPFLTNEPVPHSLLHISSNPRQCFHGAVWCKSY